MQESHKSKCAPRAGEELCGIQRFWPLDDGAWGYGVACDMGTGTISCRLYSIESDEMLGELSRENPLVRYGETIAERIEAIREGHLDAMTDSLEDALVSMTSDLADKAGVAMSDVTCMVICGNTAMECIMSRINPEDVADPLGGSSAIFGCDVDYIAANTKAITAGEAYLAPCPSLQVGGDIVCGLVAIDILHASEPVLFIDFGAYTEIALGNSRGITACSMGENKNVRDYIIALAEARGIELDDIGPVLVAGDIPDDIPQQLHARMRSVGNAAIEGVSAVLLSGEAEEELCNIVDAFECIEPKL